MPTATDTARHTAAREAYAVLGIYLAHPQAELWEASVARIRSLGIDVNFPAGREGAECLRRHLVINGWVEKPIATCFEG